jgi:hypothetical protein
MNTDITEIEINGTKYVRKDSVTIAPDLDEDMVIVRCETAGVFFGHLAEYAGAEGTAILNQCRRVWYWAGAASLSQLAVDGTSKPKECKFPAATERHIVAKVIEIIPCTKKAVESLKGVEIWKV